MDTNENNLISFEIYSSNISDSYFRRYIKIQDLIAYLGGILKFFMMTFLYLNMIFSKVEKNISIVNEVFVLNKKSANSYISKLPNKNLDKSINSHRISEKNNLRTENKANYEKLQNFSNNDIYFSLKESRKKIPILENPPISTFKKDNLNRTTCFGKSNLVTINTNNSNNIKKRENSPKEIISQNNEDYQSNMQKYLELRRSQIKINFGLKDVFNIISNDYCKKKIPKSLKENFNFYEKAKNSVEHYFDFIFMIKKFEEINIVKNCLFTPEQSKMVEIMCKPILSSKKFSKSRKSFRNIGDVDELTKDVDCFLEKMEDDRINRNIMKTIEENLRVNYV